jgi:phosphomannomutase
MGFPRHIFKMYDIRGIAGVEITPDLAFGLGREFGRMIAHEVGHLPTIVVGRDMRETSIEYQRELTRGLIEVGARVFDIGLVSTPAFYFGVGHLNADGGVMVSASHNPAQYNGFKLTRARAIPVSGDSGILELARKVQEGENVQDGEDGSVERVENIPALAAKAEFDYAGTHPIKPLKIVVDAANGMGAQYLDEMFRLIDAHVTRMYWEFDGSFPNHEADPFKDENTAELEKKVVELGADLGIATDGDGDRIFFIDDKGHKVDPAVLRGLLAQIVLRDSPGATICYDIRPGKITRDMIEQAGGVPSITRVGHSLIKEQMREVDAPFGGESSGHFFYRFNTGTYEGPVTVATQILQEITRQDMSLSQIAEPLSSRYVHSGEINFTVEDKQSTMDRIKERYRDGRLSELDGVSIEYDDFWFNVRASNTEPKLRLNLEAVDRDTMEKRRDEIIAMIKN